MFSTKQPICTCGRKTKEVLWVNMSSSLNLHWLGFYQNLILEAKFTVSTDDSECASSYSKARKVSNASLDPNSGTLCI